MKRNRLYNYIIITFLLLLFSGLPAMASEEFTMLPITVTHNRTQEAEFLSFLNQQRINAGRVPLQIDSTLQEIAEERGAELCIHYGHHGPGYAYAMSAPKKLADRGLPYAYMKEAIGVGAADAQTMYALWSTDTHNVTMMGVDFKYCGISCTRYDGKTYWVLLSHKQLVGSVSSISPGTVDKSYHIKTDLEIIIPTRFYASHVVFGSNSDEPIRSKNTGDDLGIATGYIVKDPSLLRITCNNPEIFTTDSLGHIITNKVGTGTMTVSIAGCAPRDIQITVIPQVGSMTESDGTRHEFNYSIIGPSSYTYTGSLIEPKVKMTDWYGKEMTEGVDYYLVYENNVEPGMATIIPYGIGNYEPGNGGSLVSINRRIKFTINRAPETEGAGGSGSSDGNNPVVTPSTEPQQPSTERPQPSTETPHQDEDTIKLTVKLAKTSYTATGKAIEPEVSVYNGSQKVSSLSYDVSYSNNVNPGTATVTVKGKRGYSGCTATASFTITPGASSGTENMLSVKLAKSSCTANGKTQKPGVSVYFGTKKLGKKDYTVSYKNNKNPGVATVTVKGKGSYAKYAAKASFKILPRKGTVSSFKSTGKKKAVLKWKKDASVTGFQVQVAGNAKFTSGRKTYTASAKKTSVTIKGLSSKKTYYVRIRAYKKAGNTVIYGSWSKTAKTKVK